jgi:hypothetical protein
LERFGTSKSEARCDEPHSDQPENAKPREKGHIPFDLTSALWQFRCHVNLSVLSYTDFARSGTRNITESHAVLRGNNVVLDLLR